MTARELQGFLCVSCEVVLLAPRLFCGGGRVGVSRLPRVVEQAVREC